MITFIKHFLHLSFLYIVTRLNYIFNKPPLVLNSLDSLKKINEEKLSISRYGDGEFMIINGKSIKFQSYDNDLAQRLKEILFINEKGFNVCIPSIYKFKQTRELKYNEEVFWLEEIRKYRKIYLNKDYKNKQYLDACISRFYIRYKNSDISYTLIEELKKIWNKKDIVIVEGIFSRLGVGNNLFDNANSIKRILCPNKDAYSYYSQIKDCVIKNSNNKLVIIALGPTATVLAYDLFKQGVRALDMGHLDLEYEWFIAGAKEKQLVKNKIVNEVQEKDNIEEINEQKYLESVICKIG